jgi:hypothetical protein
MAESFADDREPAMQVAGIDSIEGIARQIPADENREQTADKQNGNVIRRCSGVCLARNLAIAKSEINVAKL